MATRARLLALSDSRAMRCATASRKWALPIPSHLRIQMNVLDPLPLGTTALRGLCVRKKNHWGRGRLYPVGFSLFDAPSRPSALTRIFSPVLRLKITYSRLGEACASFLIIALASFS